MKSLFFLLIFQSSVLLSHCQTKGKEDRIEDELTKCLDKKENQTTAGMCNCTYEALNKWDKKLNIIYKSLLSTLDTAAKVKLIESQRQWIKFKEKEIDFIDATYGNADGTMWKPVRAQKVLDITKFRAIDLGTLKDEMKDF